VLALKRLFNDLKSRSVRRDSLPDVLRVMRHPIESGNLVFSYGISRRTHYPKSADYFLIANCETEATASSCITLDTNRDELRVPRAKINWVNTAATKHTLRVYAERVSEELDRRQVAETIIEQRLYQENDNWKRRIYSLYHHIGTIRMSEDPIFGVVDTRCRVHGVANLFIAGSSVFPTSGAANPTFTAIALALRLAHQTRRGWAEDMPRSKIS